MKINLKKLFKTKPVEFKLDENVAKNQKKYLHSVMPRLEKSIIDPFVRERACANVLSMDRIYTVKPMSEEEKREFCLRAWHDRLIVEEVGLYLNRNLKRLADGMLSDPFNVQMYFDDDAFSAESIEKEFVRQHELIPMPEEVGLDLGEESYNPELILCNLILNIYLFKDMFTKLVEANVILRSFVD